LKATLCGVHAYQVVGHLRVKQRGVSFENIKKDAILACLDTVEELTKDSGNFVGSRISMPQTSGINHLNPNR